MIDALEADDFSYPASCYPEIGRFLYDFVRLVQPRLVLETGTYIGYSSLCMAQALEHNGQGHIHSFDVFFDHEGYTSPVLGPRTDGLEVARGHLEATGLAHRVTFHKGDSAKTIERDLHHRGLEFDLAFIDADHTISGCFSDWNSTAPLIREGGLVILHDVKPDSSGWLGPWDLLRTLGKQSRESLHFLTLPSADGYGLAVVQKLKATSTCPVRFSLIDLLRDWLFLQKHCYNRDHFKWRTSLSRWRRQR